MAGKRKTPYGRHPLLANGRKKRVRLYLIWESMKQRCHYPKQKSYYRYGGRGISVCNEWRREYGVFRSWAIANGYRKELTLDRINVNGNYEPANCRWLSPQHQQWNSRVAIPLTFNGVTKPLPQWASEMGINPELFRMRRSNGWTDEQILSTPVLTNGQARPGVLRGRAAAKAKRLNSQSSSKGSAKR